MKRKILSFIGIAVFLISEGFILSANAQINKKPIRRDTTLTHIRIAAANNRARLDSICQQMQTWHYTGSDTLSNPYYFPLFAPATLYDKVLDEAFYLAPQDEKTDPERLRSAAIGDVLRYVYTHHPWLVRAENRVDLPITKDETAGDGGVKASVKLTEKAEKVNKAISEVPKPTEWNIDVRKPNFWKFKTNVSFQFTQNYISGNWYQGGESNNALLATAVFEANYNNKTKVTLNNTLETKIGFQSSRSDEKRKYKTNADQIRLTNKLGFKASKHWYYTIMLQSWTQFYHGYHNNDDRVYSDFMSPFECLASVGMDYRLSNSRFSLNATISPFACNFKYVDRKYLATSFGISEGKHSRYTFGSNITVNYNWKISKNINWNGRVYYFTDYDKAQIEWENTFNLTVNKYLSTRLFLYPRFDDSAKKKDGYTYLQFKELLSLGLNLNF